MFLLYCYLVNFFSTFVLKCGCRKCLCREEFCRGFPSSTAGRSWCVHTNSSLVKCSRMLEKKKKTFRVTSSRPKRQKLTRLPFDINQQLVRTHWWREGHNQGWFKAGKFEDLFRGSTMPHRKQPLPYARS